MATVAPPVTTARPGIVTGPAPVATLPRQGIGAWLTTPDHKKIGIMYMVSTFIFFLLGGVAALLVRVQLALPEGLPGQTAQPPQPIFSGELYNQIFTIH